MINQNKRYTRLQGLITTLDKHKLYKTGFFVQLLTIFYELK